MPQITFNKNITNLKDCLSHTIEPKGRAKIKVINILFYEGYEEIQEIKFWINEVPKNLSLFIGEMDNPKMKVIGIRCNIEFKNSNIVLKSDSNKPFNFIFNFEYQ